MPSADEVKNNGIELGQINTRVVEKIEELTLYIIAMNKKIEKLEKDNAELRNQLQK
jgi:TolA-binding protein